MRGGCREQRFGRYFEQPLRRWILLCTSRGGEGGFKVCAGRDVVLHGQGPQPKSPDPPSRLCALATRLHGINNLWGSLLREMVMVLRIASRMWRRVKAAVAAVTGVCEEGCKCFPKGESMKNCGQWASPLRNPWPRPFCRDGDGGFRWWSGVLVPSAPAFGRKQSRGFARCAQMERGSSQTQPWPPGRDHSDHS